MRVCFCIIFHGKENVVMNDDRLEEGKTNKTPKGTAGRKTKQSKVDWKRDEKRKSKHPKD